jgi:hypothetical protein
MGKWRMCTGACVCVCVWLCMHVCFISMPLYIFILWCFHLCRHLNELEILQSKILSLTLLSAIQYLLVIAVLHKWHELWMFSGKMSNIESETYLYNTLSCVMNCVKWLNKTVLDLFNQTFNFSVTSYRRVTKVHQIFTKWIQYILFAVTAFLH